jgi:hypothetical protein
MSAENSLNLRLAWTDPLSGQTVEQTLPLPISIGRETDNDIVVPSTSVSRHHAKIDLNEDRILIVDLGSSNGTFVRGNRIEKIELNDGDIFLAGQIEFKMTVTAERNKRPSRDFLYGALLKGEAEPTITLASLDKKALFADLDASKSTQEAKPVELPEKITGDDLKEFLTGHLKPDIAKDISSDVDTMAETYRAPSNDQEGFVAKLLGGLRRFLGG